MGALELENVTYPGTNDRKLEVTAGSVVVETLSREIGAALLRAVAGLDGGPGRWPRRHARTQVGLVRVNGNDVTKKRPHERGIGYVPAGGGLFPHLTVRENILDGAGEDLAEDAAERQADELADRLELTSSLTLLPPELLSDEERLRVALARAAMREPAARVVHLAPADRAGPGTVQVDHQRLKTMLTEQAHLRGGSAPGTLLLTEDSEVCKLFAKGGVP
jgi:ABC-type arginine transport system ATPase subunit